MGWKISIVVFCIAFSSFAQETAEGERAGLVQFTGSIYPSWMLNHPVANNYVGGQLGIYFNDHYSFRGDAFVYIGAQSNASYINDHLLIQGGFYRHFNHQKWEGFIGFSPGLSSIQTNWTNQRRFQPTLDVAGGVKFHVSNFFYFHAETHFLHMQDPWKAQNLDQLMVTGGLGFQLPMLQLVKGKSLR
jgi:hypothetical protein